MPKSKLSCALPHHNSNECTRFDRLKKLRVNGWHYLLCSTIFIFWTVETVKAQLDLPASLTITTGTSSEYIVPETIKGLRITVRGGGGGRVTTNVSCAPRGGLPASIAAMFQICSEELLKRE